MPESLPSPAQNTSNPADLSIGRLVFQRFVVFFLLLVLVLSGVSLPVYLQYKKGLQEQLLAQEEISVVSAVQMFQKEMYEQLHMLDLIIQSQTLRDYLAERTPKQRTQLEEFFANISTSFHRFDQIRLLDNAGQEKIRVNLVGDEAHLVAQEDLQNKALRYYFKVTQRMPLGQVYISAMDLNVEQEVVELPHKPTLRFATPLKDAQGEPAGVLVINYLAKGMLVRFRELMTQRFDQQGMLLDGQGYWLSNHERDNEWGADLGRPEHSFAQLYPDAWPEVSANTSGILQTKNGIFRYQSIEPLNFLDSKPAHFRIDHHSLISAESYANTNWKLVIFIPQEVIDAHSFLHQPLGRTVLVLFVLLIAGLAFLGAHFAVRRQLQQQEDLRVRHILEQHASIDSLTGISNRRHFYALGELELKRALRHKTSLAALMLDADHFKQVNDTHGHAVGDLVLKELAKIMSHTLREVDVFGRIGGEEFAVLLPNTSFTQALEVAERLRLKLAACNLPLPSGGHISFTVSIGLAMLASEERQLGSLLKKADMALYQAKQQGRNCVVSFTEAQPSSAQ